MPNDASHSCRFKRSESGADSLRQSLLRAQRSVKLSLNKLRGDIEILDRCQFPGDHPGPRLWLDLMRGLLETADRYVESSNDPGKPERTAHDLVRRATDLSVDVYHFLKIFEGSTVADLPYAVAQPMQRWLDDLNVKNSVLFRSELVMNYEVARTPKGNIAGIRDQSSSLTAAIQAVKWPFIRITVPSKAFSLVPHLAIVAHEIGHLLYDDDEFQKTLNLKIDPKKSFETVAKSIEGKTYSRALREKIQGVFLNWLEEFCADAFAYHLTGPAVFFAAGELFQTGGGDFGVGETHPANQLRMKAMHDQLVKPSGRSFAVAFKKHTGVELRLDMNSALLKSTASRLEIEGEVATNSTDGELPKICAGLHAIFPGILPQIYQATETHLRRMSPTAIYTPRQFDADLQEHLGPLLAAIPAIETGSDIVNTKPTSLVSILNVGWTVLLTKIESLQVRVGSDDLNAERLEKLHDLLLKAIELSEAKRRWQEIDRARP